MAVYTYKYTYWFRLHARVDSPVGWGKWYGSSFEYYQCNTPMQIIYITPNKFPQDN